jgi:uncharacterized protein (DUF2147 family)
MTPELIEFVAWVLNECSKIAKTIVIIGNHDFFENNIQRLDALTPIIDSLQNENVVYLKDRGVYEDGNVKVDKNNPDEAKKKTPLLGLQNLRNFVYDGEKKWIDGQIYDPENGSDYSCKMELIDNNTLEVRGFIGISLFGRTDVWKRQVLKAK